MASVSPLISVIIPVWNRPDDIRRCLDSVTRQSLPRSDYEVIVVDNGSSDETPDVARSFDGEFPAAKQVVYQHQVLDIHRAEEPVTLAILPRLQDVEFSFPIPDQRLVLVEHGSHFPDRVILLLKKGFIIRNTQRHH